MGSLGSGRHWFSKKRTVEECLTLDVNKVVKADLPGKSFAEVRWSQEGKADIPLKRGRAWLKRSRRDMVPSPIYGEE